MKESINHEIVGISELISNSKHLVIFTGAGISTASGISDFRGPDGVWTRKDKGLNPKPMTIPWDKIKPNEGHYSIVKLHEMGFVKAVISQNVDGLHLLSGLKSEILAEVHGNKNLMKCISCDSRYTKSEIYWDDEEFGRGYRSSSPVPNQPICLNCNDRIISSVVNFGDPMPEKETEFSHSQSRQSDVFIVLGSSLVVNPAAGYPRIAKKNGATLIIINKGDTPLDKLADFKLDADCNDIVPKILKELINQISI